VPSAASGRLRLVHRPVRGSEHGVAAVLRHGQRDAHRQRGQGRLAAQVDRLLDGPHHPGGQAARLDRGPHLAADHDELIAAEAAHGVLLPGRPLQAPSHLGQQLVARRVPERVVDLLEMIEIAVKHGDPPIALT